jgi:hypothetical protein
MSTATIDNRVMNVAGLIVALCLTTALMYATYIVMHIEVPEKNHDLIVYLMGFLTAQVGIVINFYYGSSSATRKQADATSSLAQTVSALTPNAPQNETVVRVVPGAGQNAEVNGKPAEQKP